MPHKTRWPPNNNWHDYDNINYREDPSVSLLLIGLFILLFFSGLLALFFSIPYLIIHYVDFWYLGEIIPWFIEIPTAFFILMFGMFMLSTASKNPITWYIYFFTPVTKIEKDVPELEIEEWIKENVHGPWRRSRFWTQMNKEYQFLKSSDAMAFKLMWI